MKRKYIGMIAGLVITAACLVLVFYNIDFKELWGALRRISPLSAIFFALFTVMMFVCRAFLWKVVVQKLGKVKFSTMFGGISIGMLVNNFLPLRAGDIYRPFYISKKTGFSKTEVLSTIIIEKIFDVLFLGLLLLLGILYGLKELSQEKSNLFLLLIGAFAIAGFVALFFLEKIISFIKNLSFLPEKIKTLLTKLLGPLVYIRNPLIFLQLCFWSLLVWLCIYASILSLIYFEVDTNVIQTAFVLMLFSFLGLLIPSSQGAIGVVQVAFCLALMPFGLTKEEAVSLSLVYQGVYYITTIVVGLPILLQSHISFKNVRENFEANQEA